VDHARKSELLQKPTLGVLLLASIPFLAICFTVPLWNRIHPIVLGLPFNLFWLILWIPLTTLCMWLAYKRDRKAESAEAESAKGDWR
jgi:hypothetical protein